MKVLTVLVPMFFSAAGFVQPAMGTLACWSGCSACWKDNAPGVDIKINCHSSVIGPAICGTGCPAGYNDQHCANRIVASTSDLFAKWKLVSSGLTKHSQTLVVKK
jgi:hypothetical protein